MSFDRESFLYSIITAQLYVVQSALCKIGHPSYLNIFVFQLNVTVLFAQEQHKYVYVYSDVRKDFYSQIYEFITTI